MPSRRLYAKAFFKTFQKWLCQRDFGQQDQNLFSLPHRLGDRLEIGFGLARSRYAIKNKGTKSTIAYSRCHDVSSGLLSFIQFRGRKIGQWFWKWRIDADCYGFKGARLDQTANDIVANPCFSSKLADKTLRPFQRVQRRRALGG